MDSIEAFKKITILIEVNKLEEARLYLDKIEDKIPNAGNFLKFTGQVYQRVGEDKKSLQYLLRARDLLPDDTSLYLCLGYHYLDNGAPKKAIDYFYKYLAVEKPSSRVLCFLARAHSYIGNKDKAENFLRHAVQITPSDLEAQLHLGRLLMLNEKYIEARECFRFMHLFYPEDFMVEIGLRRSNAFLAGSVNTDIKIKANQPATVVCVKYGLKYGADYVNRLSSMVQRWSTIEPDFVCFTEDGNGLNSNVRVISLPEKNSLGHAVHGWWNKLALFQRKFEEIGSHMLYFDLDVVITGIIDPLLFYDSDFAIASNFYAPSFSSSIMRIKNGVRPDIWTDFSENETKRYATSP